MNEKDGGPAFGVGMIRETAESTRTTGGMTLRDYFAAKAMQAFVSNHAIGRIMEQFGVDNDGAHPILAQGCYRVADAMLVEREK